MDHFSIFLVLAITFCLLMTWGVGANDLANVMSTTMGSKAVTAKQGILIAIVFEFLGAFFGGTGVTETMRDGIINTSALLDRPEVLIQGMLSVLVACTIWMNLASYFGFPVSITNALVGSMVGFGAVVLGRDAVHWGEVSHIALGWITSPLIAGITAYFLFYTIQQFIFIKPDPLQSAKRIVPCYLFLVGCILSFITVFKGLRHFHVHLNGVQNFSVVIITSILIMLVGIIVMKNMPKKVHLRRRDRFIQVEKYFAVLMAMTACAMVFAHGANDVALAVGPLSVVHSLVVHSYQSIQATGYPSWIILLGCFGVVCGFLMYGRKVIETVGSSITALTPSRAFAATLAAATTVVVSTSLGIPVSATQTLVGAVFGVGLARGIGALNLIVIRNIFMSWVLTLPAASLLTIIIYTGIHYVY